MNPLPPSWASLIRALNDAPPMCGDAGVRDPEYPCDAFDPLPDRVKPTGRGDCMGDGHYMCRECSMLSAESPNWPASDCPECGPYTVGCTRCGDTGVIDQPGWERDRGGARRGDE